MNPNPLQKLRRQLQFWLAFRGALWIGAALGAAALAVVVLDAALDLPETLRAVLPVGVGAAVVAGVGAIVLALRRVTAGRVARQFELAEPALGSRLTNAVQFSGVQVAGEVGEFLRREAVELGRRAAAGLGVGPVARRGVVRALGVAVLVAAGWAVLVGVEAEVWRAVWPRLVEPRGDHPPFSRMKFAVTPTRAEVLFGGNVAVRAAVSGMPVDKLWLVARTASNETRTSMFLAPDKTFFQTLANLREPAEYFVTDGRARSYRFPIKVKYTPQITLVEMTTEFPSYTGRAAKTAALTDEVRALPADTVVRFRVGSNRPLAGGTLTLTPVLGGKAAEVKLEPESDSTAPHPNPLPLGERGLGANIVAGQFTLTEPVAFAVAIRDTEGLAGSETRTGRLNVLPDERPRLFVLEPGRDAVATPLYKVPVRVQARDDYGVTRVVWLRGHNRSIERPFSMPVELKGGGQSVEARGAFDLEKLGVVPGDVIEYYFEAADNWPAGPHVSLSKLYRLEVISLEQYEMILRAAAARKALFQPYMALSAWLRRLAERARNAQGKLEREGDAAQPAAMKEVAALAKELAKFREDLAKLLAMLPMFDVEQTFHVALQETDERTAWARDRLEDAQADGKITGKELGEIAEQLAELAKREEEKVGDPARKIVQVVQLLARGREVVRLAKQQAELARFLRRFAEQKDLARLEQMEVQELAHAQRRIQQAWQDWLAALPLLIAALPDTGAYVKLRDDANELLTAAQNLEVEKEFQSAVEKLNGLNPKDAYPPATAAAEKLAQLIAAAEKLPEDGRNALQEDQGLQKGLGKTLDQILEAMGLADGPRDGYSLFDEDRALYGPNVELAGDQMGRGEAESDGKGAGRAQLPGATGEPNVKRTEVTARVRLQPDAKFPLRYRELVGEYFKQVAESEEK